MMNRNASSNVITISESVASSSIFGSPQLQAKVISDPENPLKYPSGSHFS